MYCWGLSLFILLFYMTSHSVNIRDFFFEYTCPESENTTIHFQCSQDLRHFIVGAGDLPAREPIPSAHSTLVHPLVGSYDLVAACLHTLALDTHRRGVRATRGAVNHLQQCTGCNKLKPMRVFFFNCEHVETDTTAFFFAVDCCPT